jgi:hypothetical protein
VRILINTKRKRTQRLNRRVLKGGRKDGEDGEDGSRKKGRRE